MIKLSIYFLCVQAQFKLIKTTFISLSSNYSEAAFFAITIRCNVQLLFFRLSTHVLPRQCPQTDWLSLFTLQSRLLKSYTHARTHTPLLFFLSLHLSLLLLPLIFDTPLPWMWKPAVLLCIYDVVVDVVVVVVVVATGSKAKEAAKKRALVHQRAMCDPRKERECVCVCEWERERECVCVCVCVRERERERVSLSLLLRFCCFTSSFSYGSLCHTRLGKRDVARSTPKWLVRVDRSVWPLQQLSLVQNELGLKNLWWACFSGRNCWVCRCRVGGRWNLSTWWRRRRRPCFCRELHLKKVVLKYYDATSSTDHPVSGRFESDRTKAKAFTHKPPMFLVKVSAWQDGGKKTSSSSHSLLLLLLAQLQVCA